MASDNALETIMCQIRKECTEDHVGLWEILKNVKRRFPESSAADHRSLSLEVVRDILGDTKIRAGFPTKDGRSFNPWDLSIDEIVARINEEWEALDRDPTIGDIVWFTAMD